MICPLRALIAGVQPVVTSTREQISSGYSDCQRS